MLQRLAFPLAWLSVFLGHLTLAAYFEPPGTLLGRQPVSGCDYDTHIQQAWRVVEGLKHWGHSWVYDVHLLAGHPNGVIFDADNKGWEFLTFALVSLGMRQALAFNTFVILAHLLVVPVVYASARLFNLARGSALLAAAMASALWFFDSHVHWIWWVGTLAFAFASYFFLLPLSLFHRFCEKRSAWHALACAVCLSVAHLIHPYTFFLLATPMAVLYLQAFRTCSARDHACVAGVALFTLAVNAPWLLASLRQWHYILDSGYIGQGRASQLAADFFGLVVDISTTGTTPNRTTLRFACFGAALLTLHRYAKSRDGRFAPLALGLGAMLLVAYLGGYSKVAAQIQPYRLMDGAIFLAVVPAADAASWLRERSAWGAAPSALARAVFLIAGLLLLKQVGNEVAGYFPDLLPQIPSAFDGTPSPVSATGYAPSLNLRQAPNHPLFWELPKWVEAHATTGGRFLIQNGALGEQLAWKTHAEIMGGFVLRNLEHARANLARRRLEGPLTHEQVRAYLEAYAIEWVVLSYRDPWFESMPELFEWNATVAGAIVLRTKVPISRLEQGTGTVFASTNRIAVMDSNPRQDVVLRYHFHEMLECGPNCELAPYPNPVGGVPFIRVPAPHPASFAIRNTYEIHPHR